MATESIITTKQSGVTKVMVSIALIFLVFTFLGQPIFEMVGNAIGIPINVPSFSLFVIGICVIGILGIVFNRFVFGDTIFSSKSLIVTAIMIGVLLAIMIMIPNLLPDSMSIIRQSLLSVLGTAP